MDESRFQELERQRGREEYSRQVADQSAEYEKISNKEYVKVLKSARNLPCICGMCRQLIDEEIKVYE